MFKKYKNILRYKKKCKNQTKTYSNIHKYTKIYKNVKT